VHLHTHSVSTPKSSSFQSSFACGANRGIGWSDVHVLHKADCSEICVNVSQFVCTGLDTSSSAQLAGCQNSGTNLVIASGASFQPPLAEFSVLSLLLTGLLQHLILIQVLHFLPHIHHSENGAHIQCISGAMASSISSIK